MTVFFPQFATHNAHTLAAVQAFAASNRDFEFQRLHGMGEALYEFYERRHAVRADLARRRASMRLSAAMRICSPI